jgi:hypothetical protein
MAGDWYALGRIQSFGNDATGQVVSLAAAATIWGEEELDYLYVADYVIENGQVAFAPGAVQKAIAEYGRPKDQDRINAVCERALTADPDEVAAMYIEMLELERREMDDFFACGHCTPGIGNA